jgi:uncharacterized membrane protein (GlpM family)
MQYVVKTLISAILIVAISEVSKRSTLIGGLLASLPLTSLLAFLWLYYETRNPQAIADLAINILWLVIPSLILFILLPLLLKKQMAFYPALLISCLATAIAYSGMLALLKRLGH